MWYEGAQRASVQDRPPEEREGTRDLEDGGPARPSGNGADEPTQLGGPNERPGMALDFEGHAGGSEQEGLRQGQVGPERQFGR
jgi:hypothetical protein